MPTVAAARGEPDPARPSPRSQSTRDALIELAAELFAERGYVQTSVRDISRQGALTTGAIYGHFRNKADLLAEAISARTAAELEAQTLATGEELDYVESLTELAREYTRRRRLRALIVQGAAAAQTDDETRTRLREEQLTHINSWLDAYERERERMGIDPSVDMAAAVLYTWAVELGLGVLESMGIQPSSPDAWADASNRFARSLQLAPDEARAPAPRKVKRARTSSRRRS
jgi:TetR/AcrR family acrAB operon transcriptional repressor